MLARAKPNDRSTWNFQQLISVTVSIKCISGNFDIDNIRSGQFCDLSIISQWEKIEWRLFRTKTIHNTLNHLVGDIGMYVLDTLSRNIATSDPSSCRQGQFRSWKVTGSFSAITFDRNKLERWKHFLYAFRQIIQIYWYATLNMTFFRSGYDM